MVITAQRRSGRWSVVLGAVALAVVAAVVLMHHVVGAHQHGPTSTVSVAASHHQTAPASEAVHEHGPTAADHGEQPRATAANLHVHDAGEHHGSTGGPGALDLLHLCLAVLGAVAALAALGLVASWWRTTGPARPGPQATVLLPIPRAPPVPVRLARLQVLRL